MLAERVILKHLTDGGLLMGDVEQMMEVRLGAVFMPHGLGHLMGLDVHDCGGYLGVRYFLWPLTSYPIVNLGNFFQIKIKRMLIVMD